MSIDTRARIQESLRRGNRYSIDEIHFFRIRDGQMVEHWHEFDRMALLAQLSGEPPG